MTAAPIIDAKNRSTTRNQAQQHAEYLVVDLDPERAARMRFEPVLDLFCADRDQSVDDSRVVGCRVAGLADADGDCHEEQGSPKTGGAAVLVGDVVAAIDGRNVLACDFGDVVSRLVNQARAKTTTTRSVTLRRGAAGDDGTDLVEQQARNRGIGTRWRPRARHDQVPAEGTAPGTVAEAVSSSSGGAGGPPSRSGAQSSSGDGAKRCPPRRRCNVDGCTNQVVRDGVCISHGAKRKTCSAPGCDKRVKRLGLCSAHGPSRKRCEAVGCAKVAVSGGRCVSHGARKRLCKAGGCQKWGIVKGMCRRHHQAVQRGERELEQVQPPTTSSMSGTFDDDVTITPDEVTSQMMAPRMGSDPQGVVCPETGHDGTCHFSAAGGGGEGETDLQDRPLHRNSDVTSEGEPFERIEHYKTPSVDVVHQHEYQHSSLHHRESAAQGPTRTVTGAGDGATAPGADDRDEFVEMLQFLDDFEVEGGGGTQAAQAAPSPCRATFPAPAWKRGVDYASECTLPRDESSRRGGDIVAERGGDGRGIDDEFVVGDLDFITRGTSFATEYGTVRKTCNLCGAFCICNGMNAKDNLSGGMESEIMSLEDVAGFGRRSKQYLFPTRSRAIDRMGADCQYYNSFTECDGNMLSRPRSTTNHGVSCIRKRRRSVGEEDPQEEEMAKRGKQTHADGDPLAASSPFAPDDAPAGGPSASAGANRSSTRDCIICGKNEDLPMCHFVGDGACHDGNGGAETTKWSSRDVSVHTFCGVIAKLGPNAMPEYEVWSVGAIQKNFGRFPGFSGAMTRTRQAQASTDAMQGDESYCLLGEFHQNLQHAFVANEDGCRPDSPLTIAKPSEGVSSVSEYSPRTVTKMCVEVDAGAPSESPTTVIDPSDGIWDN